MIQKDDFIGYMIATDQLDEFLGLKENIVKCPNCMEELYIYERNLLYCKKCQYMYEHNKNEKLSNKRLTYIEKSNIKG